MKALVLHKLGTNQIFVAKVCPAVLKHIPSRAISYYYAIYVYLGELLAFVSVRELIAMIGYLCVFSYYKSKCKL